MSEQLEQYIQFSIDKGSYAVKISDIHEIIKLQDITEIPNVKEYVRGVINLRGRVVPVISLRSLFHLERDSAAKLSRIIVVNHRENTVGIMVDQVHRVTRFSDIQPPPAQVGGINGEYFVGIGVTPEALVGILQLEQVLLKEEESA